MGIQELHDRYDRKNSVQAINAAVRAEIPGGAKLLNLVARLYAKIHDPTVSPPDELVTLYGELLAVQEEMKAAIAERYELKNHCKRNDHDHNQSEVE